MALSIITRTLKSKTHFVKMIDQFDVMKHKVQVRRVNVASVYGHRIPANGLFWCVFSLKTCFKLVAMSMQGQGLEFLVRGRWMKMWLP